MMLFKADHARRVDDFIEYFGGPNPPVPADACGEELLDLLLTEHEAPPVELPLAATPR